MPTRPSRESPAGECPWDSRRRYRHGRDCRPCETANREPSESGGGCRCRSPGCGRVVGFAPYGCNNRSVIWKGRRMCHPYGGFAGSSFDRLRMSGWKPASHVGATHASPLRYGVAGYLNRAAMRSPTVISSPGLRPNMWMVMKSSSSRTRVQTGGSPSLRRSRRS